MSVKLTNKQRDEIVEASMGLHCTLDEKILSKEVKLNGLTKHKDFINHERAYDTRMRHIEKKGLTQEDCEIAPVRSVLDHLKSIEYSTVSRLLIYNVQHPCLNQLTFPLIGNAMPRTGTREQGEYLKVLKKYA